MFATAHSVLFLFTLASLSPASTSVEVVFCIDVDANGDLQIYEGDELLDDTIIVDSDVAYVFPDFDDSSGISWEVDVVELNPSSDLTCTHIADVVECLHDGSSTIDVVLEATSTSGHVKRKPFTILPPPETQPAQSEMPDAQT